MYNVVADDDTRTIGQRTIVNLNGQWVVGESVEPDAAPDHFGHTAAVPGLLSTAQPAFPDVGAFETRFKQYGNKNIELVTAGVVSLPTDEAALAHPMGVAYQERNYFWYRRTFRAPTQHSFATLNVLKARFGSKIWVNGTVIGQNDSCFTSARYDVSKSIRWGEDNEIVIRIGAHQGVLPEGNTCPEDCEHEKWYPGVWDDVELYCFNNPEIHSVQIAPEINPHQILVETELRNLEDTETDVNLHHRVMTADLRTVLTESEVTYTLPARQTLTVRSVIPLPDASLWTPEDPNLYILDSSSGGDSELNRFGLREVGFRTSTRRFHLNGEIYYLRGGLITLDRFFEDPLSGSLPWSEEWVRKLLGDTRRSMSWNMTKYCLSDVPRKWLDIADEEGLMGVPELPIWCFNPDKPEAFNGYTKSYDRQTLLADTRQWVRDHRNHPSVIYWSAALETATEWLGEEVIPTGRALDLQQRAWLNSYNPPVGPDDPLEDHPYQFTTNGLSEEWGATPFDMIQLETRTGHDRHHAFGTPGVPTGHAQVISEYEWLWLTRGGEPALYLANTYHKLPYPVSTPEQRLETNNYLLAGMTEYWRAHRNYAQVAYNAWLAGDMGPGRAYVVDNFKDPVTQEFQPAFLKYVREAFKPLGVYIEFWKREVQALEERIFFVMLVNDHHEEKSGELTLRLEYEDESLELGRRDFVMGANGSTTTKWIVNVPERLGKATLSATAVTPDGLSTRSARWVEVKQEIPPRPYGQF